MVPEIATQQVANNSFFLDPREIDDDELAPSFFVISRVFQKTTNFQFFLAQPERPKEPTIWLVLPLISR